MELYYLLEMKVLTAYWSVFLLKIKQHYFIYTFIFQYVVKYNLHNQLLNCCINFKNCFVEHTNK